MLADPPLSDWPILRLWTEEGERWQGSVTIRRRLSAYLNRRAAGTLRVTRRELGYSLTNGWKVGQMAHAATELQLGSRGTDRASNLEPTR